MVDCSTGVKGQAVVDCLLHTCELQPAVALWKQNLIGCLRCKARGCEKLYFLTRRGVHMSFYLYLLLGFLGGIPAGMGMGGGTVTIPLLTLLGGVEQKIAQSANLFSFLPMSVSALKTHADNGLLETKGILWDIIPALFSSAVGALFATSLPSDVLKKAFGVFLIGLSFVTLRGALEK